MPAVTQYGTTTEPKRVRYERLRGAMDNERQSFMAHWRDLADYYLPRRAQFQTSDTNKGSKVNQKIIDSTATLALRTLKAGMTAGITSPARPWFRLSTPDPALAEFGPVKTWLEQVRQRMVTVFLQSNLYNALPTVYGDEAAFGTGCMLVMEDDLEVIRCYPFPIGSYWIANDARLQVSVFMREFKLSVRQVVERFCPVDGKGQPDLSNLSTSTASLWRNHSREQWVEIVQVIGPNDSANRSALSSKYLPYTSCYYEKGGEQDKILSESGFEEFPVLAPRWDTAGEDIYGTSCPGMDALGDTKELQLKRKRLAEAIEKGVRPPMTGPTALKNSKASIVAGDITYADAQTAQQGFRPAFQVTLNIDHLKMDIQEIQQRISRAFYEDLFLMLAMTDRREITAREIEERHEEKLLMLGPTLERQNNELLDPLIDRVFGIMARRHLIPPPPEDVQGMDLKVEYISIMAQAQKQVGFNGLLRYVGFVGSMAASKPDVIDKVDLDQAADVCADILGVPPEIVRSDEQVMEIRDARARAQMAQQRVEQLTQMAQGAKLLSETDTSRESALTAVAGAVAGGGA